MSCCEPVFKSETDTQMLKEEEESVRESARWKTLLVVWMSMLSYHTLKGSF